MSRKTVKSYLVNEKKEHDPCISATEIKEQKKNKADERNKAYRAQFKTLQDELNFCLKVGGRAKQVRKLQEKIKHEQKQRKTV